MSDNKGTILLVHPRIKLSPKVRRQLDSEGFILIRGEPGDVTYRGESADDVVLRVALECLLDNTYSDNGNYRARLGRTFARQVLNLLPPLPETAKEPPKK